MDVDPSAMPLRRQPLHGLRIADLWPDPDGAGAGDVETNRGRRAAAPLPACPGRVVWLVPQHLARECVRAGGHGGDHCDAAGYHWNDHRWSD